MPATASADLSRLGQGARLHAGKVFRRKDLAASLPSVDRELGRALKAGLVRRVAQGLYYVPRHTPFGEAPPSEEELVRSFLDDDHFLLFNPSVYNSLGLGTTQLYRSSVVYNHKRHGLFTLAGFEFDFRVKPRFPARDQISREYLLVDMLNNLDQLAEDPDVLLDAVRRRLDRFDAARLEQALRDYGSARTRRLFRPWVSAHDAQG